MPASPTPTVSPVTPANAVNAVNAALSSAAATATAATVAIGRDGRGSGFVVADGVVLTNAHTLRASTTQIRFADGRTVQGEVRSTDSDGDLIAISVDTGSVTPLSLADVAPTPGSYVIAAHGDGSVAVGHVAATGRSFPGPRGQSIGNALEHTGSLPRGASGGPLVDVDGRLVAINTNRSDAGYQAIAVTGAVRARLDALIAGTSFHRRQLGVSLAPASTAAQIRKAAGLPEAVGLLVRGVADDSPASRAGLLQGDVITSADGATTETLSQLAEALARPAETVVLAVVRGTSTIEVSVSFADPVA